MTNMTDWKSIESAPKDGTHILLFFVGQSFRYLEGGGVIEGRFNNNTWEVIHLDRHGRGEDCMDDQQPTYWMPLPKLPISTITKNKP